MLIRPSPLQVIPGFENAAAHQHIDRLPYRRPQQELPPLKRARLEAAAPNASATLRRAPLPSAPSEVPEPFDRKAAAQQQPKLYRYLLELEMARDINVQPPVDDALHLKNMIAGLNAADPKLKLEYHELMAEDTQSYIQECSFTQRLGRAIGQGDSWRAVIDDGDHRMAVDIRSSRTSNDASLLLITSGVLDEEDKEQMLDMWPNVIAAMTGALQKQQGPGAAPVRLHLNVVGSGVQHTPEGCSIFALSAAKKMASDPAIAALQDQVLADLRQGKAQPGVQAISPGKLPPSLHKHATSFGTIAQYMMHAASAGQDTGDVNKKGQSLLQRHNAQLIERFDPKAGKMRVYSPSYEDKRIEIVRNALTHLTTPKP